MTEAGDSTSRRLQVSWEQFHRDCRTLAQHLRTFGPFRAMIAITRGGLVPAAIVACELSIRVIETISISSYAGEDRQDEAQILKTMPPGFADNGGEGLLIVDDLVDTGRTATIMRALLPKAHLATVYAKPLGRPLVDTCVIEVLQDTWIDFPWDLDLAAEASISTEKS